MISNVFLDSDWTSNDILKERVDDEGYQFRVDSYLEGDYISSARLTITRHRVVKTTKCGVWVDNYGSKRFVLNNSHKKFCCSTRGEALASFIARKRRQVRILNSQLNYANLALRKALGLADAVSLKKIEDDKV